MSEQELEKLVQSKISEALNGSDHPKKYFIKENGRGVVDGGDLYNDLLRDVLQVVQTALVGILKETALKKK